MHKEYDYDKSFNIRTVICFFLVSVCFLSCILRVAVIASGDLSEAQATQSSYRIEIGNIRGTIYDCNRIPITNSETELVAAVIPSPYSVTALSKAVSADKKEEVLKLLEGDSPFIYNVERKLDGDTAVTTLYYRHNNPDTPAAHLIGYTNSDNHGVSGLEKAYDSILYSKKKASAVFYTDGRGQVIKGGGIKIENDTSVIADGVVSSIDINIQLAAEAAAEKIEKGAVVVADVKSGKIKAMVSRPDFDMTDVSSSLNADTAPLLNRAVSAYNVGSAFKPCVAAAALEEENAGYTVSCNGYEEIEDRRFNCHKLDGHKAVNLRKALTLSCNVFFYNMALKLGTDAVYGMASALGFGKRIRLADNFYTAEGNLTSRSALSNNAELANLSIGQGRLLLTPVSMLNLYCAIATDGSYYLPSVTEGVLTDGTFKATEQGLPTRVMSADTAAVLREYLTDVVTDGTGISAKPKKCTAAGKTATAQTGKYENGIEITHSWFCGFFPAQNPQYAVIVLVEGGVGSAEIFSATADKIVEIKGME